MTAIEGVTKKYWTFTAVADISLVPGRPDDRFLDLARERLRSGSCAATRWLTAARWSRQNAKS
jgi:hypothetical protein